MFFNPVGRQPVSFGKATSSKDPKFVVIAEDDGPIRNFLADAIGELGIPVKTATNGAEALELVREQPDQIGMVVTDYQMPIMDGLALTQRLRAELLTRDIPVVLLSANYDIERIAKGASVDAVISKPVDLDTLEAAVKARVNLTA
jgi:CheY-like chemotaxis protein